MLRILSLLKTVTRHGWRPRKTGTETGKGPDGMSMVLEILQYQPYSYAVDWWALGVLLYELLTGRVRSTKHGPAPVHAT